MVASGFARAPSLGRAHYFLALAAATAHLSYAIEAPLPSATRAGQYPMAEMIGFSPKPTEPPRIRGRMASDVLFARAENDNAVFCGYVSANPSSPVACADFRRVCLFNVGIRAVGCCVNADSPPEECSQYTSCINRSQITSCTGSCAVDPYVVTCTDTASPSCWTYEWQGGMSSLGCGATSFSANVAVSYSGQTKATTTSATSASVVSGTMAATSSAGGSGGGSSSTNIGAIVGGAVSGFAVLAGLIVALVYFIPKHRRQKQAALNEKSGTAPPPPHLQTFDQQQWSHDSSGYTPATPTPMYTGMSAYGTPSDENSPMPKVGDYYGQSPEPPSELSGNARSELPTERFDPPAPPPPPLEPIRQEPAREPGATLFPPPASAL